MAQQNRINKIATDLDLDNLMLTDNEIQAVTGDLILATDGTNELKLQVGGSTYVDFFSSGAVSMPNQPSFFAYANAAVGNVTGAGVEVTVGYNTEKYDITNNYASNTFTAPITGLTSLMVGLSLKLNTSNQAYQVFNNPWLSSAAGTSGSINFSCVTDMDSADTAYITFIIYGGASNTADLQGTASTYSTYFSGHLIY
jgi:hypothetical protein